MQPIPLFVLSTRYFPSPDTLRNPGLLDVVHRAEVDFEPPPGNWRPPPAGGMLLSCLTHWWLAFWLGRFRPGDVGRERGI